MNALVTTSKSFLKVNIKTGEKKYLDRDNGRYYGIAYDDDAVYLAARSGETETNLAGKIIVYDDYNFNFWRVFKPPFGLRNMHQIHFDSGKLYVTCTWDNWIAVWDKEKDKWSKWIPNPPKFGKDYNHINSINFRGGITYVVAKNEGDVPSELWAFDTFGKDIYKKNLGAYGVHNFWHMNGDQYFLESDRSKIRSIQGYEQQCGKGWLRGVAAPIEEDYILIGESPKSDRKDRDFADATIHVFDMDFIKVKEILLEKEGNIHEIRTPGYYDAAYRSYIGREI